MIFNKRERGREGRRERERGDVFEREGKLLVAAGHP